jgi:hypothetical protein
MSDPLHDPTDPATRRRGFTLVALAVVALAIAGAGIVASERSGSSSHGDRAGSAATAQPTTGPVDPRTLELPSRWHLDSAKSTKDLAVFSSTLGSLQVSSMDSSDMSDLETFRGGGDFAAMKAGVTEQSRASFPGYHQTSIERSSPIAGLPTITHEFTLTVGRSPATANQFLLLDDSRHMFLAVTAFRSEPLHDSDVPGIRADIGAAIRAL